MSVRPQVTAVWQESIDHVRHQPGMSLRAVAVIEASDVPRNVRDAALPMIYKRQARYRRFDFVAPDLFRRAEHRCRNERENRTIHRRQRRVLAVEKNQLRI